MPPATAQIQIGMKFNQLTVLGKGSPAKTGHPRWDCQCVCGRIKPIRQSHLNAGTVESCGCLGLKRRIKAQTIHGMYGTPEYKSWCSMKRRCNTVTDDNYHNYGGRGITVYPAWNDSFQAFFDDMGKRPSSKHSLDRIDNDGDYEPTNCRWATAVEQGNNRRTNTLITIGDKTQTIKQWANEMGIEYQRFIARLSDGYSFEEAATYPKYLHRPHKNARWITYQGETKILKDWCNKLNLRYGLVHGRLQKGWDAERALSTP